MSWLDGHRMQVSAVLAAVVALITATNTAWKYMPQALESQITQSIILVASAFGVWGLAGKFEKQRAATVENTLATQQVAAATQQVAAATTVTATAAVTDAADLQPRQSAR